MSRSPSDEPDSLSLRDEIVSIVDDVLEECPRFRILVIGRSGVGKSSLINAIFGEGFADVKHGREAGVSDIRKEFTSEKNKRLILHDSQGFSHGDSANFDTVKNFIKEHGNETDTKNKLHAIWLCTEVPTYDSALLESGDEEILNFNIPNIPIIAVLTKYDGYVNMIEHSTNDDSALYDNIEDALNCDVDIDEQMSSEPNTQDEVLHVKESLLLEARENLSKEVIKDKLNVPWVPVSVKPEYSETLKELVSQTLNSIEDTLPVQTVWATAQNTNAEMKVNACIKILKKGYWKGLSTSLNLPGHSLAKWLQSVHLDIVKIWNFDDPSGILGSKASMKMISDLQSDLVDEINTQAVQDNAKRVLNGASAVAAAIPIHAVPFVAPVAFTVIFAMWVYNAVKLTPRILRGMLGYIVDLSSIMDSLFVLVQARKDASKPSDVTDALFKLAVAAYVNDEYEALLTLNHNRIQSIAGGAKQAVAKAEVLRNVETLMREQKFKPSDGFIEKARNL